MASEQSSDSSSERINFDVPKDPSKNTEPVEILFSSQTDSTQISTSERAIAAVLVHLDRFQVLILPTVTEASLTNLKCNHADVVYCGRLRERRFPRNLIVSKLSPSILILNGTKPEVLADPQDGSPKCLYVKQDGSVTAALLNGELVDSELSRIRVSFTKSEPINGQFFHQKLFLKIGQRITFIRPMPSVAKDSSRPLPW